MRKLSALLLFVCFAAAAAAQEADLLVTKTGPESATAGSNVTYTVTVNNLGPDAAAAVTLRDIMPEGMTFVSVTQNSGPAFDCQAPAPGDRTATCSIATLAVNAPAQFAFVFQIPAATAAGTVFTNIARVTASIETPDPNEENNSGVATTSTPPAPQADLHVSKTGPPAAGPGTNVSFTLILTNAGPGAATNVTLTDMLPGSPPPPDEPIYTLTFVSLTQTGTALNCATPAVGAPGTVTCTAATYAAGATTRLVLTAKVPENTPAGTAFTNTVNVTSDNDPGKENNAGTFGFTTSSVDVSVAKTGPASVTVGSNISYEITVENNGDDAAAGVVLTDHLPPGTTLVSITQNSGPATNCVPSATAVQCTFALPLGTGRSATFTLVLNPRNNSSVTNTATVTSESFDTDPADNSSSVTTTIEPRADLVIAKSGPASVTAGSNVTYTVTVTNGGPSPAVNVTVSDPTPANTTFVSTTYAPVASLAPNATVSFTYVFRVSPSATGTVVNTASVSSNTADPDLSDNSSTTNTAITSSADVTVTKTAPATATAGANVTYTVVVVNAGPSDAANIVLTDVLPAGTTFVSANQSGHPFTCTTGPTITCTTPVMAPQATTTFTFTAAVAAGATGNVNNTATVTSTTPDPNLSNNTSTAPVAVGSSTDVSVTKSAPATATGGTNVIYTVIVTNGGPSTATNVALTDVLPAGATFVSASQSGHAFNCTTGPTITCTTATMPAQATTTFTFTVAIASGTAGNVNNTATVTTSTTDPHPANNTSTATTAVTSTADVSVTKSAPATAAAGTNVIYTVIVANAGPSDALNVVLTDVLPGSTTFVSASQSGHPFTCVTGPTITCTAATMPPQASTTFTFTVTLAAAATGAVNNTATVTTSSADPNQGNNTSTATTGINPGSTDLSITKSAGGERIPAGGLVTYTIVATNNGPAVAFGTTVTDVLPEGTTLESASASQGSCTGTTTVVCSVGTLAPTASATITLIVRVPRNATTLTNTATITAANAETTPGNNASTAAVAVTNDIPTVSEWGLILLAAMMLGAALMKMM